MSLLTIVQRAALRVGIEPPNAVIGSTDLQTQQLANLAQEEAEELATKNWNKLIVPYTFTTLAQMEQTGKLPADADRFSAGACMWWVDMFRQIKGPLDAEEWAAAISRPQSPGLWGYWRVIQGQINLWPVPAADQPIRLEYLTKNWCIHVSGDPSDEWTADNDTCLMPEKLVRLGVIWRWLQMKGLDYAEPMATYERELERAIAQDGGMKTISMSASRQRWPGFNWSQTITVP